MLGWHVLMGLDHRLRFLRCNDLPDRGKEDFSFLCKQLSQLTLLHELVSRFRILNLLPHLRDERLIELRNLLGGLLLILLLNQPRILRALGRWKHKFPGFEGLLLDGGSL